jgi:hypothetical protein
MLPHQARCFHITRLVTAHRADQLASNVKLSTQYFHVIFSGDLRAGCGNCICSLLVGPQLTHAHYPVADASLKCAHFQSTILGIHWYGR